MPIAKRSGGVTVAPLSSAVAIPFRRRCGFVEDIRAFSWVSAKTSPMLGACKHQLLITFAPREFLRLVLFTR
jgi:hypothetical protein